MLLPILLLSLAALFAALVAYGTHPHLAAADLGLQLIYFSRQYQWPLSTASILLCLTVVALVVAGKRRAWWLIGLGPVLALFVHRFQTDPLRGFAIADDPPFAPIEQTAFLGDEDYVIGAVINSEAYAYPYQSIYATPVVVHADHDKRVILFWSPFANRAVAYLLDRDVRARDFDIVSMPANALLAYNHKFGQFINGFTGLTNTGQKPTGFGQNIPLQKLPWKEWRTAHPSTRVMAPSLQIRTRTTPKVPVKPFFPMKKDSGALPADAQVVLIEANPPAVMIAEQITTTPMNLTVGELPILLFREKSSNRIRAFERRIDDLRPRFTINRDLRRPGPALIDSDTNSGWTIDGKAIDGHASRERRQLASIPVDQNLYWGVVQYWMPEITIIEPPAPPATQSSPARPARPGTP